MKILFPIERRSMKQHWLGIMYLSAVLKKEGFNTEVAVAEEKIVANKLKENEPTILAYSTPTFLARFNIGFNQRIKKRFPDVFSIFGGPHATYYPEMIEHEGVDAICLGEGEWAMLELAESMAKGKAIAGIKNLWVKENGTIHRNQIRPLIQDLDELPYPDRDIFHSYHPRYPLSSTWAMSSRGCPYRCTYCFNHAYRKLYKGQGYPVILRRRSVDNFIDELVHIKKKWPATYFVFADDIFILMPEWVKEFAEKYKKLVGLPFTCHVRANLVTEDVISDLKRVGCFLIKMGVEAGNDRLRTEVFKRKMSKEQILNAAKIIKNNRIKVQTFNIIGIPTGNIEADFETLELSAKCKAEYAMSFILRPYSRTEIYSFARERNLLHEEFIEDAADTHNYYFSSPITRDPKEARLLPNLLYLFSISVRFPFLIPLTKRLIRVPIGAVYKLFLTNHYRYVRSFPFYPNKLRRLSIYFREKLRNHNAIRS